MFLEFLLFLRTGGFQVSLNEWLSLMEGLRMGLHGQTLKGFYILCRTLLVRKESELDKFEEAFHAYFRDVTPQQLQKEMEALPDDAERTEQIFADYMEQSGLDHRMMRKIIEERMAAVEAGSGDERWTGTGQLTGGNMLQGAGGKSIIHARGDRRFRDWRADQVIGSRQFQMAFRLLRELSRMETGEEELDIRGTIHHTCMRGGLLDIRMQPPRKNRLKLMVLIDSGGSMRPYEQLCSMLFQSLYKVNTFADLKIYYFHNCLEGALYKDPSIDAEAVVKTEWVLRNISGDYRTIFVGDADMAMYELEMEWFRRFREKYPRSIWLHPQEKEENIAWMSESFIEIGKVFPMFRLSIDGLKDGMYRLMKA